MTTLVRSRCRGFYFILITIFGGLYNTAVADDYALGAYSPQEALAYSQSVLGKPINNYVVTDQHGTRQRLSDFHGKPLVVSFIYTSCYHYCPTITRNLKQVVEIASETLGKERFNVMSIGFDAPNDTPERMRQFAKELNISDDNWYFVSARQEVIQPMTREFGFLYAQTPKGFDHMAQITVLDADGRIYRHVYGTDYTPQHVIEPLKELTFGQANHMPLTLDDWIENIRLFCTVYDPTTGRYQFDYSVVLSFVIGFLCLGAVLGFVVYSWRANRALKYPDGTGP